MTSSMGPNVVHQVFLASTLYGCVARCGCGWRAVHDARDAATASGKRHAWTSHGAVPLPSVGDTTKGAA